MKTQLWLDRFLFVTIITVLGMLCAGESTDAQTKMEKLHVGYSAQAGSLAPIWITKEAGIFKKHGLDVELLFIPGGPTAAAALLSGEVPITVVGGPAVVSSNLAGSDLVMIAGIVNTFAFQIVTVKGITSSQQLKGKRLGVSGFGSASHNAALILLKKFNLEPNKDVALVVAGPTMERLAAVDAARIDATILTPSELPRARKQGLVEVYDMLDLGIEVQGNGFATSRSFIRSNREVALAALKGYVEALFYISRNREETRRITGKYMRSTDADVLDATYEWFVKRVSKRPYPTLKGIQYLLDEVASKLPNAKSAKPEQFVDLSLLQQLEREGFFGEMAKRYP